MFSHLAARPCAFVLAVIALLAAARAQAASPPLERATFDVCGTSFELEIARSQAQQRQGLSQRKHLGAGQGMVFVLERNRPIAMWMKDVYFPLEIAFFDVDGRFVNYAHAEPVPPGSPIADREIPIYRSAGPVRFVVEINPGLFATLATPETCRLAPLPPLP